MYTCIRCAYSPSLYVIFAEHLSTGLCQCSCIRWRSIFEFVVLYSNHTPYACKTRHLHLISKWTPDAKPMVGDYTLKLGDVTQKYVKHWIAWQSINLYATLSLHCPGPLCGPYCLARIFGGNREYVLLVSSCTGNPLSKSKIHIQISTFLEYA